MEFSISKSIEVLERTPEVLTAMLNDLDPEWTTANEGENTWNAKEVVAHLIICEKTNWMVRTKIILSEGHENTFVPIDMKGHFELAKHRSMKALLEEFKQLRKRSIEELNDLNLRETDFIKTGMHPTLGQVYLRELISTWVAHDLSHTAQISRIMAKQYKDNVGAFATFLKILT